MRRALCRVLGMTLLFGIVLGSRPATADPCPADYNGDGLVNEDDLYAFQEVWHDAVEADINQDGLVNEDDVYAFLNDCYYPGLSCGDANHDGVVSLDDLYYFLQAYARVTHSPSTDFDGDGHVTESGSTDVGDWFAFLAHWFGGC